MIAAVMALGSLVCASAVSLPVVPRVKSWNPAATGEWVRPKKVGISAKGAAAVGVAQALADDWRKVFGADAIGPGADVTLALEADAALGDEGYRMAVGAKGVVLRAATKRGLYWATRTLLQLVRAGKAVPCGEIFDKPDYPLRGFTFDVARKYFPIGFLRALAQELAYYKMNTFHVHLNDDRVADALSYWAFRLESDIPGLTSRDGSYTKDEFRAFVKECAAIGVNVVPEFDAPGHALAFITLRPELRLKGGWDQMDVANPGSIGFVKKLWDEYLDGPDPVFPGPDVHAGTDEYFRGSSEGYRAFADELFRHLLAKGRKVHAWGSFSSCTGQTSVVASRDITIDLWHHESYFPEKAAADGYSLVTVPGSSLYIVPGATYYNDYVKEKSIITRWNPSVGDGDHPIPAAKQILRGGKFAIWNDNFGNGITSDDVFDRFYPAMRAVAEKTWASDATDWDDYAARASRVGEAPGLDLADADNPESLGWGERGWEVSFQFRSSGWKETLFDDGYAKVRIFPCGKFGFSRDGYDVEFAFAPETDRWYDIRMTGTRQGTALYVDGKLVDDLRPETRCFPGGKRWPHKVYRTLHFPLVPAVGRTSRVKNLKAVRLGK